MEDEIHPIPRAGDDETHSLRQRIHDLAQRRQRHWAEMVGAPPHGTRAHLSSTLRLTAELADAYAMKRAALAIFPTRNDFFPGDPALHALHV